MTLLSVTACSIILRVPYATPVEESCRDRQTTLILVAARVNIEWAITKLV